MAKTKPTQSAKPAKPSAISITSDPLIRCALNAMPELEPEVRAGVSCGEHEVDFTLHFKGRLKVGADSLAKQVNKLQPWTLVKILAGKMSDELFTKCLDEAVCAAVANSEMPSGDDIKDRVQAAIDQISPHITTLRKGSVRFFGAVEIVDG